MSGRLCCYKQQQHSKLLAQSVFKVSAFRFNACTKTRAPLHDCRINNALIHFLPGCQDIRTQLVDVLDLPFSDIVCSIHYLMLSRGNFYAEKQHGNKVLPFGTRGSSNYATKCIYSFIYWQHVMCVCHLSHWCALLKIGWYEMPFDRDTCVVRCNTVLDRVPGSHGKGRGDKKTDLGVGTPVCKLFWTLLLLAVIVWF